MATLIPSQELEKEKVYFVQLRTNSQITLPRDAVTDKNLQVGDVLAVAVLKIMDKDTTWQVLKDRYGDLL